MLDGPAAGGSRKIAANAASLGQPGGCFMCIFDILIDMVGYTVARLILPLISFGRLSVQPLNAPRESFNAFGYRRDGRGRIEIEQTIAGFIGFALCLAAFLAVSLLTRAAL